MDHVLENKFLNKEGAAKEALQEKDEDEKHDQHEIAGGSTEEAQYKIFESFVKEKFSLLGYIRAMVLYSAKVQGFDEEMIKMIYPPGDSSYKEKTIKNEQDLLQFKNRIIIIVIIDSSH